MPRELGASKFPDQERDFEFLGIYARVMEGKRAAGGQMSISNVWVAASAAVGFVALLAAGPASASPTALPFPGTGTTYTSAANGSGHIPSGGASAFMFTAGDNIDETFTGTGVTSVDSLKVDFNIDDLLNGSSEKVLIAVNGTPVANFVVPDNSGVDGVTTIAASIFFAPIFGNGTYELTMTLVDTVPGGQGSIDFQDGGVFALNGGVRVVRTPEPISLSLFAAGFVAAIAIRRRGPKKQTR